MAVISNRSIVIGFAGDITFNESFSAAENIVSPGQIDIITLSSGDNVITPPDGGTTPLGVTIIPPIGNTQTITLRGDIGDTGVLLDPANPTSLALGSSTNTFILVAGADIQGVRLIWS